MPLRILGEIEETETIAKGRGIREHRRLVKTYGKGNWVKMKGIASVELPNGETRRAEIHWYQAHGVGRKEAKIKRLLPE